jgi:cell division protein FtsI (penicillin-binding protein 3)
MLDRMGNIIEDVGTLREPQDGSDLQLSIDTRIQYHVFDAVRDAVNHHRAAAGAAVVLDAKTGEVLALANLPTYDPNERGALSGAQLRNRVMTDTFEPGSTFKPFAISAALEAGIVKPSSMVNCAGKLTIGSASVGDAHGHGTLSVEEVLQKSSNVGTAKIALQLPPQRMWELYNSLGFGQAPEVGFPGAVAGRVRPWKTWKPIEQATMSYGHGVSVSLLQLARAYTVFARDGEIIPLTFLKSEQPAVGQRVMTAETARAVRRMLELAAGPGGTAPKAQIPGFSVAGKTGTAHKLEGGRYVTRYVSSFVGFAPASNPRVIIAVMIDEPSAGEHYGGTVAAPIFARIASDTMRTLRVTPDIPLRAENSAGSKAGAGSGPSGSVPGSIPAAGTAAVGKTARAPARSRGNA